LKILKLKNGISGKAGALLLPLCLLVSCMTNEPSPVPTRWMGPTADGHYPDTGLLGEWPEGGPEILWTCDSLGTGFSSAVIQNNFLYTAGMIDSTGYLFKLTLKGELVYRVPYGREWTGSTRGTRGSPTLVGEKAYLVSGMGKVVCFSSADGKIIWSRDMFRDFDGLNITWGINETPVVDGEMIYITPGGKEHNVVALDRHNGELVWTCKGKGDVSAYCTPLLFEHNGRKLLTTYTAGSLLGIDPLTGELLWTVDVHWEWSVHLNTPIYQGGRIFFPTGLEVGGGMAELSEDGSSVEVLWRNQGCDTRYTAILVDGYIYGSFSDNRDLTWRCIEWKTGREAWRSRELSFGQAIFADGMLYLYTSNGEILLVRPDPGALKVISRARVTHGSGLHLAKPVIHDGVLYVRHGDAMIAYELKNES
jgi:outer membrane protein assembly factor BamB